MKKKSVFFQIALILFLISVVPVCVLTYYNGRMMQRNSENVIAEQLMEKLEANGRLSDTMLSNIMYLSLDIVLVKQYAPLSTVKTYEALNSDYESVRASMKVYQELKNLVDRNALVRSAFYYSEDADYVVASEGTVVRKQDYGDLDWLRKAIKSMKGAQGVWYPRIIETKGYDGSSNKTNVISYIYRISSLFTSAKGVIVVDVYEEELGRLVTARDEEILMQGGIIDSKGNVICYSDKNNLFENIGEQPFIIPVLASKADTGWGMVGDKRNEVLYTYKRSELYDWFYVNLYSIDMIFADSSMKLKKSLILTIGILLLGSIFTMYIAFKISKPIRHLVREIRLVANDSNEAGMEKNELQYLGQAVEKIKQQERELNEKLRDREYIARRAVTRKLLQGEMLLESESESLRQWFPYNHFIVCILTVDGLVEYYQETTHEVREYHRYSLNEMTKSMFPESFVSGSCRYSSSSTAVVLNLKEYDRIGVMKSIRETITAIQKKSKQELGISLSAGISSVHNNFENVRICAEEAFEAMEQRMVAGAGHILTYQENAINRRISYQKYIHENKIFNYLEINDMENLRKELYQMIEEIKVLGGMGADQIMLIFNQMIGKTMIYLNEHNLSDGHIFGVQNNLFSILSQKENLDEIGQYMELVFRTIIHYQSQEGGVTGTKLYRTVLLYLQEHYKEDVDFEALASLAGVSYSYLRKIIKQETEKSLIDNLNLIRIEAAKDKLVNTDIPVAEIALLCGYHNVQALNRFFKKFEGLAPGEYREKYRS